MGSDAKKAGGVTRRAFVLGLILSGVFAWLTVVFDNGEAMGLAYRNLSGSLLPVLPHMVLLLAGLLVNPLLRLTRGLIRPFAKAELLLVFVMTVVSAGVASWGLSGLLVPVMSGYANRDWNTDQRQWDASVAPFLDERYFLVADGTRALASDLRDRHLRFEEARTRYRTARDVLYAREELAQVESYLETLAQIENPEVRRTREEAMFWPHQQAQELVARTEASWEEFGGGLDPQEVVESYPALIQERRRERDTLREALHAINADYYDEVGVLRRGMPVEKRAVPGFVYSFGEGFASYASRFRRLRVGLASRRVLEELSGQLSVAMKDGTVLPAHWAEDLRAAALSLDGISDIPVLARLHDARMAELEQLETELAAQEQDGRRLRHLRRFSELHQFQMFTDLIAESDQSAGELGQQVEQLRAEIEMRIQPLLAVRDRVRTTRNDLVRLADDAEDAGSESYVVLQQRLQAAIAQYPGFDASLQRFWLGDVQWGFWLGPVFSWFALMGLVYLVFMSFNTLIFRQWAHNEKLIYPLAELATLLSDHADAREQTKTFLRSGLFWTGFAISAGVLGWNYLATSHIVPNIRPIGLQTWWIYHVGGALRGLASTYFVVIFAVIGVAFLVPSKISFSLWIFEVLYMGLLLVMVWLGYGENRWSLGNPGRFGIGAGAMLVFGVSILWTCRRYLLCAFKPDALKGLAEDEARELRVSSVLFLVSSLLLMLVLIFQLGANPFYVVVFYFLVLVMTISLVRAVAEGGLLGLQSHATVFSVMKLIFGMTGGWTAPALIAPVFIFGGMVFGGFRAFIAPMMANALKVREEFRMRRLHFHISIWAGIAIAAVVSVVTVIMLSYQYGADNMQEWLHTSASREMFINLHSWVTDTSPPKIGDRRWLIAGIALMSALLIGRRRFFGVPHPIGLLMIMNPNMFGFWGSIMIGWLFKSAVSKYCTHEQYISIRRLFIGLIIGHLVAVLFGWDSLRFHWG